jgi:hypothetical protein
MCNKVWDRFRRILRVDGNSKEATLVSMFNKIMLCVGLKKIFKPMGSLDLVV